MHHGCTGYLTSAVFAHCLCLQVVCEALYHALLLWVHTFASFVHDPLGNVKLEGV